MSSNGVTTGSLPANPNPPAPVTPGLAPEQLDALRSLAGRGLSDGQIAEEMGLGIGTIRRYARRLGLQLQRGGAPATAAAAESSSSTTETTETAAEAAQQGAGEPEQGQQAAPPQAPPKKRTRRSRKNEEKPPEQPPAGKLVETPSEADFRLVGQIVHEALRLDVDPAEYVAQMARRVEAWDRVGRHAEATRGQ